MPTMVLGSAGSNCAADRPALTWRGVAPNACASADDCLASTTVAQVMKVVLAAARMTSITVMITASSLRRSIFRLSSPAWPRALKVWLARIATIPVTVTAMLSAFRTPRRGRRASSRRPWSARLDSTELARNRARGEHPDLLGAEALHRPAADRDHHPQRQHEPAH